MSDSTRGVPGTSVVPEPGSGGNGDSQRKRVAFVESQPADAKPPKQKKGPTTSSKDAVQEFNAPEQSPVKKQFRMAAVELGNENQPLGAGNSGAGGAASTGGSGKSSKRSEPASKPPEPFDRSKISIDDPISAAEAAIDMQYDAPAKRRRGGFADKLVDSVGVKETRIRQSQLHSGSNLPQKNEQVARPKPSGGQMVAVSKRGVLNNDWTGQCDNVESLANGDIVVHQSDIELSGEEVEEESEAAKKKKGMQNFRMKLQQSEAKRAEEERAKALSSAPRFLSFAEWRRQKMSYFRNAVNAMGGGGGMEDQLDKMKKGELQLNFDDIKQMMSRIGGKKDRFVMKFVMQEAEQAQMEFQQGNFVQRPAFQAMAAFLVSAQIFLVGYATEFISYSDPIDNRLLWAILDIALVLPFFLFEFSQRFKVLGFAYFDIYTHDFFFLMVGVFEASYPLWVGGEILKATKILQLGRIVNLSRLKDVIYQFPRIRKIVTEGMAAFDFATVFKAAMWCLLLITLMTYMWTLLVTSTLGQEVEETLKYRKTSGTDLRSYFGHVVWGFNSFLGLMSMEHNIIDRMARGTAEAHGMGIMIIFLFFIAFARFGMLNVLIAQICARAIITSAEQREFSDEISDKEHQIALAKLGAIFRSLDADESGTISRQELMEVCELEQVKIQLRIAQIEHDDVIELFELLGTIGEDGEETELGTEEFIGACMRLKGDGKSKDCFIVQLSVVQLTEKIDYLSRTTGRSLRCLDASRVLVDKMDQILKRLQRMVPHRPGVDRNVNTEEKLYVIPEYSTRGGVPYGFRKLASGQTRGYDRGFVPRRDEFQRLGGVHNQSHIKKHVDKAKAVLSKQMKAIGIQRSEHAEEIASALQSLTGSNAPASYLAEQQRKLSTPPKDPNIPDKPATPALSTKLVPPPGAPPAAPGTVQRYQDFPEKMDMDIMRAQTPGSQRGK